MKPPLANASLAKLGINREMQGSPNEWSLPVMGIMALKVTVLLFSVTIFQHRLLKLSSAYWEIWGGGARNNRTGTADWLRKNRAVMVKPIT